MGLLERHDGTRRVVLCAEHVVGRSPSCALQLEPRFVSTAHALIRWSPGGWELRDLGSRNGTFVDGVRITAGKIARLAQGADLSFGDRAERWRLSDDGAPSAVAIPLDGGAPVSCRSGMLVIISSRGVPIATIFAHGEQWILERGDVRLPLANGQLFEVQERPWRFECPPGATQTLVANNPTSLHDVTLVLSVSSDEEHVKLSLARDGTRTVLGERTCFYLALVLARQRIADRLAGLPEHGWLCLDTLLGMIPEYSSSSSLNVEIHRLRRTLIDAGIHDGAHVIERRRGQVRLGTERVAIAAMAE